MAGQSIMDRVVAARHSIAGQGLAKSVCKATTEEIIGPKRKHLDYLIHCTNEPNVSIPQMADLLIERTQHQSWVVVFKSLVSIHNLMNYGNERFTQYLASNNCSFSLSSFVDKGGVQGYDMSTYIRRYAKYLNEKAVTYRSMAFDFCKVKRGKEDGLLRRMNTEKLLKTLPTLQQQLDALLEFDCTPNELTNGVITACFMLLFKDLIRLFACYNDGIINLLEKYFDMNKKQCKDGLDLYKKFLVRMDKVSEFLKVAENMGIDKGDIPDLAKAPASLLDALEQHLASLEGKKGATTPTGGSSKPAGFTSALNTITTNTFNVSEAEKKRILEEENQQLQRLKAGDEPQQSVEDEEKSNTENLFEQKSATSPQQTPPAANNPFAAASPSTTAAAAPPQASSNLFGSPTEPTPGAAAGANKPSDDLLSLTGNPFMDNVQNVMASAYSGQQAGGAPAANNPFGAPPMQANGFSASTNDSNGFTSDADFARAFSNGKTTTQEVSPLQLPSVKQSSTAASSSNSSGFDAFGDVLQPMNKTAGAAAPQPSQQAKPLGSDLDTSLASLASNLNVGGGAAALKKDHQWQPKAESKLTGGNSFQRQPMAQSTTTGVPQWGSAQQGFQQPNMMGAPGAPMMYQQPMGTPMGQPMMGMVQPMGMMGMPMQPGMQQGMQPGMQQPGMGMMGGMPAAAPGMYNPQQPAMMGAFQPQRPAAPSNSGTSAVNDPFGAL